MRPSLQLSLVILILALLAFATTPAQADNDITAGPMIGSTTDKSARLWLELSVAKDVTVTCFEVESGRAVSRVSQDVSTPIPFVCAVPLSALAPNRNYRIEVELGGKPVPIPGPQTIIHTAPPPGAEATFDIAFGSNLASNGPGAVGGKNSAPALKAIEQLNPRTMLFLGNVGTLPEDPKLWPAKSRDAHRVIISEYSRTRRQPDLQALLRTTPCYSVWNDKDFGPIQPDKNFVFKQETWAAFQRYWPNPQWGMPEKETPGCFYTFTLGDVDFFMLDSRMYRDPDSDPNRKTMLGDAQLTWLKNNLAASKATFKIIGCGSQLLADYAQGDTWANYQPEQSNFIKWIFDNRIEGVLFVTGGGVGEISAVKQAGNHPNAYPLFEISSGPLAGKAKDVAKLQNPQRQGEPVKTVNFATLDFGGMREHRFVTLRLRDVNGKPVADPVTLLAHQLKK